MKCEYCQSDMGNSMYCYNCGFRKQSNIEMDEAKTKIKKLVNMIPRKGPYRPKDIIALSELFYFYDQLCDEQEKLPSKGQIETFRGIFEDKFNTMLDENINNEDPKTFRYYEGIIEKSFDPGNIVKSNDVKEKKCTGRSSNVNSILGLFDENDTQKKSDNIHDTALQPKIFHQQINTRVEVKPRKEKQDQIQVKQQDPPKMKKRVFNQGLSIKNTEKIQEPVKNENKDITGLLTDDGCAMLETSKENTNRPLQYQDVERPLMEEKGMRQTSNGGNRYFEDQSINSKDLEDIFEEVEESPEPVKKKKKAKASKKNKKKTLSTDDKSTKSKRTKKKNKPLKVKRGGKLVILDPEADEEYDDFYEPEPVATEAETSFVIGKTNANLKLIIGLGAALLIGVGVILYGLMRFFI